MSESFRYHIGTLGEPWGDAEKQQWLAEQTVKRSYFDDVVSRIEKLRQDFAVEQYGELAYADKVGRNYPLYLVKTKSWNTQLPTILVTGGVHGYETSGVHGALRFLETRAGYFQDFCNVIVAPCLSPWGYETINRWNPHAVDPNRSFVQPVAPAAESGLLMQALADVSDQLLLHIDLHETTDTDNSEFRPALAALKGTVNDNWNIPDGFYLVGDTKKPELDFQRAIIAQVKQVTHIADADDSGRIIGEPLAEHGVILYDGKGAGLCMGLSNARYVTTTEVYPDSANATPEACIQAQVAAVEGALKFALDGVA